MSSTQFTATFTQKSLVTALTQVRKGAKVHSGENWLDHADHTYGIDYVAIIVKNREALLITANQWHSDVEGAAWTFSRVECRGEGEGTFCVPIRVLHDYVKTFSASDAITITYDGAQTHTVLTKPERIAYNVSDPVGRKLARDAELAPAVEKQVPDNLLTITCGRNKANIVGKPAADLVAWESLIDARAAVEAQATVEQFTYSYEQFLDWTTEGAKSRMRYAEGATCPVSFPKPVAKPAASVKEMRGNGIRWFAVILNGEEIAHYPCRPDAQRRADALNDNYAPKAEKPRYRVTLAQMRAYHGLTDEADAIADAAIAAITGEEYSAPAFVAPTFVAPAFVAPALEPTPIRPAAPYTPRVGDTVNVVYRHENGTTTNRTVDVQRVGNGLFRGYDRTYGRVRNFEYRHLAQIVLAGKEAVA